MINITLMKKFLCAGNHENVIALVEHTVGANKKSWITLRNKKSTIYIPRNITKTLPVLCAHTDTIFLKKPTLETLKIKHGIMFNDMKLSGLGADDRAGCYILTHTMKTNPEDFIFCFFDEEESGCRGSKDFQVSGIENYVKLWIGFDRKGNSDIVTYGNDNDKLLALIKKDYFPKYKKEFGSMTDVSHLAQETNIACLNFSIGYEKEHTAKETLELSSLEKTFTIIEPILGLKDKTYPIEKQNYYDRYNSHDSIYHTYYCPKCYREYYPGDKKDNICCGTKMINTYYGGMYDD